MCWPTSRSIVVVVVFFLIKDWNISHKNNFAHTDYPILQKKNF